MLLQFFPVDISISFNSRTSGDPYFLYTTACRGILHDYFNLDVLYAVKDKDIIFILIKISFVVLIPESTIRLSAIAGLE